MNKHSLRTSGLPYLFYDTWSTTHMKYLTTFSPMIIQYEILNSIYNDHYTVLKSREALREQCRSYRPISLLCRHQIFLSGFSCCPLQRPWELASLSTVSKQGTPPARLCSRSLQGWSPALTSFRFTASPPPNWDDPPIPTRTQSG